MTSVTLARSYFEKARNRLRALQTLLEDEGYSDVVREAQELVEVALKGMLRFVGVEPPKQHDVGPLLVQHRERLPEAVAGCARIRQALIDQSGRVTLTSRAFRSDQLAKLYERLHQLTGLDMSLPMNSGAEAVETAQKAARKWGHTVKGIPAGKAEIIACEGNFHGRTISIVSFSTEAQYREGFEPLTPGFKIIPYGNAKALSEAITPHTCAFLVEPIQGEAGIVIPPDGFLAEAAAICRKGTCCSSPTRSSRASGAPARCSRSSTRASAPTRCIIGKALSGGFYPVSAVVAGRDVLGGPLGGKLHILLWI